MWVHFILVSVLTCVVYTLANGFTYHMMTCSYRCGSKPLHDVLHGLLPDWSHHVHIRDYVLAVFFVPFLLVRDKFTFVVQLWEAFMLIVLVKAVCIFFTFIPPSNALCDEKRYMNHCYHSSTSGHAAITLLLAMLYIRHGMFTKITPIVYVVVGLYCILILMTRAHYTVDICQALIITYLIMQAHA